MLQAATGRYAPEGYHQRIGFQVARPALERAFQATYGMKLNEVFHNVSLAIDKAIPCGLVANELCTNALKYAFPQEVRRRRCELRVELRRVEGQRVLLAISDNGVGLPTDFEFSRAATLGMQIVEKLVKQLDAA